jgi:hypothetical protein
MPDFIGIPRHYARNIADFHEFFLLDLSADAATYLMLTQTSKQVNLYQDYEFFLPNLVIKRFSAPNY